MSLAYVNFLIKRNIDVSVTRVNHINLSDYSLHETYMLRLSRGLGFCILAIIVIVMVNRIEIFCEFEVSFSELVKCVPASAENINYFKYRLNEPAYDFVNLPIDSRTLLWQHIKL